MSVNDKLKEGKIIINGKFKSVLSKMEAFVLMNNKTLYFKKKLIKHYIQF